MLNSKKNSSGWNRVGAAIVPLCLLSGAVSAASIDGILESDGVSTASTSNPPGNITTLLNVNFQTDAGMWLDMNEATTSPNERISFSIYTPVTATRLSIQVVKPGGETLPKPLSWFNWYTSISAPEDAQAVFNPSASNFIEPVHSQNNSAEGFSWVFSNVAAGSPIYVDLLAWTGLDTDDWWVNIDLNTHDSSQAPPSPPANVPLPGAIWLFGSGLLGLLGLSNRKRS